MAKLKTRQTQISEFSPKMHALRSVHNFSDGEVGVDGMKLEP